MNKNILFYITTAVLCVTVPNTIFGKETKTKGEENYYTLEVERKAYEIEEIAPVLLGEDYQKDETQENRWYSDTGALRNESDKWYYYKDGYYSSYTMFGYSNWHWQYQDIYLESKFPEEGDEKDKEQAISYGEELMEKLGISYSEISTYFMGIESVNIWDELYSVEFVAPGYTDEDGKPINDRKWSEEDGAWLVLFRG